MKKYLQIVILFFVSSFFNVESAFSQQTIINLPSSEVLPKGNLILKGSTKFRPFESGGYTAVTPTVIMGIGHGMDISLGVGSTINNDFKTSVKGNVGLKKVFFLGNSTRLTIGGDVSPSFMNTVMPDTFAYAHITQRIKQSRTSITAGGYINGREHFLNTGGVVFGVDQVLIPNKLRLAFDWMSGENNCGRMGVGLKYRPISTLSVTSAVIIPNENTENISFSISLSKYISIDDIKLNKRRFDNEKENSL